MSTPTTGKPKLVFVTGNANKLREVQAILFGGTSSTESNPTTTTTTTTTSSDFPFELVSHKLDLPELQGTTQSIAREKCAEAAKLLNSAVITEDTALCFSALNGLPGPYIKWFLESVGHEGLNRMLDGFEGNRDATALCTFAYCPGPGKEVLLFEGKTEGRIVRPRGPNSFGWDPVFEPVEGGGRTYAEMPKEEKNRISHRYRALEKLRSFLKDEAAKGGN